jgi:GNAT superfamily N-acetyltransferase
MLENVVARVPVPRSLFAMRIDGHVTEQDEREVILGLLRFNEARLGPKNDSPVRFVVRGDDGAVLGGLIGVIRWKWLYVSKLWVSDALRGKGYGKKLLQAAEDFARERGCTDVSLDTFEFQAKPFYEKLGYKIFGTLDGYPPGYKQFYLTKRL